MLRSKRKEKKPLRAHFILMKYFRSFCPTFYLCLFEILLLTLSACSQPASTSMLTFSECLEKKEAVPLATWIQAIVKESLDSLGDSPVQIRQTKNMEEISVEETTIISYSSQEETLEQIYYINGKSHPQDELGAKSLNALRIKNNKQTNLNASSGDSGILYVSNIFSRDPLYENLSQGATNYLCNVLCLDRYALIEAYPSYFTSTIEEMEDGIRLTWICNNPQELKEKIAGSKFSKLGSGFSDQFKEDLVCNDQGQLQQATWTNGNPITQSIITVNRFPDPEALNGYFRDLFDSSKTIGDALNTSILE